MHRSLRSLPSINPSLQYWLTMSRTFNFHDCGAIIEGVLVTSAPRSPPIGNLRSLKKCAKYINKLKFVSSMDAAYFNSSPVRDLLSQAFPSLQELRLWVHSSSPVSEVPFPFTVSLDLHPQLRVLGLSGVQISMHSSLSALHELELCNYPPGAQPVERFRFTPLLNTAHSLQKLVLRAYLTNAYVDKEQLIQEFDRIYDALSLQDPGDGQLTEIYLPNLKSLFLEDTQRNTAQFIEWMSRQLPQKTYVTAIYGVTDLTTRFSPTEQGSLLLDAIVQRTNPNQPEIPPTVFCRVTAARLSFEGESIKLVCTGPYSERHPDIAMDLVIQLKLGEYRLLDRVSRIRVHAMALQSVRWMLCDAGRTMRTLDVVGASDDLGADAWLELLNTIYMVTNPALRELNIVQSQERSTGRSLEELRRALLMQRRHLPGGLQVFVVRGTTRTRIFEMGA